MAFYKRLIHPEFEAVRRRWSCLHLQLFWRFHFSGGICIAHPLHWLQALIEKLSENTKLTVNINLHSTWCEIGGTAIDSNVWDTSLSGCGSINGYSWPITDHLGCYRELEMEFYLPLVPWILKLRIPFEGSFRLLSPTPETPDPEMVDEATLRPPTAWPPMPIFWPVAAFIITLLLAEGGLLPIKLLEKDGN